MLLHGFVPISRANGPGRRAVLWFQGCTLACPGCWNPQTHRFEGQSTDGSEIVERVLTLRRRGEIDGVTFSGGEPIQQAPSLIDLIKRLGELDRAPMSFGMFTGYSLAELDAGRFHTYEACADRSGVWRQIRARLDFAVTGRYNQRMPSGLPLRSSRNQRLHLFTDRYLQSDFEAELVEVTIEPDGVATVTGFPVLGIPA